MPRYLVEVFTSPVAGQSQAYNQWYDGVHLPEILTLDGFLSARRCRVSDCERETYLALYDVEAASPADIMSRLSAAAGTMAFSPAFDKTSARVRIFEALADWLHRQPSGAEHTDRSAT